MWGANLLIALAVGTCGRRAYNRKYEEETENCAKTGSGCFLCTSGQYEGNQK